MAKLPLAVVLLLLLLLLLTLPWLLLLLVLLPLLKTVTSPARRAAAARWRRGIAAPSGPWQRNRGFRLHTEFSLVGWTRVGILGSPIGFGTLASKTLGVLWLGLPAVPEVCWPVWGSEISGVLKCSWSFRVFGVRS